MEFPSRSGGLRLVEVPTADDGVEVLWGDQLEGLITILSVPVFAYGISKETLISAKPRGDRLRLLQVLQPSPGATLRVYAEPGVIASELYVGRILPDAARLGLGIGPSTFFDPEIVAFHVGDRGCLSLVTSYLDELAAERKLKFWELGDPPTSQSAIEESGPSEPPWELVHQLPTEGRAALATMH